MSDDQRCQYCDREMSCSAASYRENPFCRLCLHERVATAAAAQGPTRLVSVGDNYVMVMSRTATMTPDDLIAWTRARIEEEVQRRMRIEVERVLAAVEGPTMEAVDNVAREYLGGTKPPRKKPRWSKAARAEAGERTRRYWAERRKRNLAAGTPVTVMCDNGTRFETVTQRPPRQRRDGTWVVTTFAGRWLLSQVRVR
jgi:hypothetical protein